MRSAARPPPVSTSVTSQIRTLLSAELTASREPSGLKATEEVIPALGADVSSRIVVPRSGIPQPVRCPAAGDFRQPLAVRAIRQGGRRRPGLEPQAAPRPSRRPRRGPRPRTGTASGPAGFVRAARRASIGTERHRVLQRARLAGPATGSRGVACRRRGPRSSGRSPPCLPGGRSPRPTARPSGRRPRRSALRRDRRACTRRDRSPSRRP